MADLSGKSSTPKTATSFNQGTRNLGVYDSTLLKPLSTSDIVVTGGAEHQNYHELLRAVHT